MGLEFVFIITRARFSWPISSSFGLWQLTWRRFNMRRFGGLSSLLDNLLFQLYIRNQGIKILTSRMLWLSSRKRSDRCFGSATFPFSRTCLEQRQYKSDSIQSKIIPTLKLPLFFTTKQRKKQRKKRDKFKIGIIFDWMESFLFCLCSSISFYLKQNLKNRKLMFLMSSFMKIVILVILASKYCYWIKY